MGAKNGQVPMTKFRDREWLLAAARGEITTNAALRNVQIMRARLEDGDLHPELAAALAEGDAKYPDVPERYVALRVGPDPIETDPETNEAIDRLLEELPDGGPEGQPDIDPRDLPPADRIRHSLLTTEQILDLPPPDWLIDNYLVKNSLALLYGPSGCGKTFLALDWTLSIATGSSWHDNRVDGGAVLYVAAEGVAGIGKRVKAWMEHNRVDNLGEHHRIHWLPYAVDVATQGSVEALAEVAEELQPSLIVVDTLARSIVDADENSAKDMGGVIRNLDQLRRATGACVLLVHHTGKDISAGARGSSALRAAVDTELEVFSTNSRMTVKVTKQREAAEAPHMRLTRVEVAESCVLVPTSSVESGDDRSAGMDAALDALREMAVPGGVAPGTWKTETGMSKATFYRHLRRLLDAGLVKNVGTEKRPLYVPVDKEER